MAVVAHQRDVLHREGEQCDQLRMSVSDVYAELGIHPSGVYCGVGVGVYAGGEAEQDLLLNAHLFCDSVYSLQLIHAVADEIADAAFYGEADILISLIVALEEGFFHREAGLKGCIYLSAGHNVHAEVFLTDYLINTLEACGFGRVHSHGALTEVFADGFYILAAVFAYASLIHQVKGSAVFFGKLTAAVLAEVKLIIADGHIG